MLLIVNYMITVSHRVIKWVGQTAATHAHHTSKLFVQVFVVHVVLLFLVLSIKRISSSSSLLSWWRVKGSCASLLAVQKWYNSSLSSSHSVRPSTPAALVLSILESSLHCVSKHGIVAIQPYVSQYSQSAYSVECSISAL